MTTRPVISLDQGRDYAFSAPLAALFWRHVIGYEPLIILADTESDWTASRRSKVALDAMRHHGFDVRFVGHVEGYETGRIGQNAREHAGIYRDLAPDDWLMMSDADLWPLSRTYHRQHEGSAKRAVCLNGMLDHFQGRDVLLDRLARGVRFQTIPTCCVTMRVSDWRERYGLIAGADIAPAIKITLDWWTSTCIKENADRGFWMWMMDQDIVTHRIVTADWFPSGLELVERIPMRRLDRGEWNPGAMSESLDSHIFKRPDCEENWAKLREVVAMFAPSQLAWADAYRSDFRNSYAD